MVAASQDDVLKAPADETKLGIENKVNVQSSPSIMTGENKKAVIMQIGEQWTVSLDVKQEVNDVARPSARRSTRRASRTAKRKPPCSC